MNMASLMFLVMLCDSLWTMLKQSMLIGDPVKLVCWGMEPWDVLWVSPNALPVSPIYSSGQLIVGHLYLYMTPLFCSLVSLSLGTISKVLRVFEPLKCTCILSCYMSFWTFHRIPVYMEPPWICSSYCCCLPSSAAAYKLCYDFQYHLCICLARNGSCPRESSALWS